MCQFFCELVFYDSNSHHGTLLPLHHESPVPNKIFFMIRNFDGALTHDEIWTEN